MISKSYSYKLKRLFFAQGVSILGDTFTNIAITWFILRTGTVLNMGINFALMFVPEVILAPFIGNIVDRFSRKKLMWITDLIRMILDVFLIILILNGYFSIYMIYIYTFCKFSLRMVYTPAQSTLIQLLTNADNRTSSNALHQLVMNVAFLIGPVLAGLASDKLEMEVIVLIDAITFFISAAVIFFLRVDESAVAKEKEQSYFSELKDGWRFVRENIWIVAFSLCLALLNSGRAFCELARPYLVNQVLGLGVRELGILDSIGSAGAIFASIVFVKIKLNAHKLSQIATAAIIMGLTIGLLSIAPNYWVVMLLVFCSTAMAISMGINTRSLYQDKIPSQYMGRVFAVRSIISVIAMPISYLLGASFINFVGVRSSFLVAGVIVLISGLLIYWVKKRNTQKMLPKYRKTL